MDNKFKLKVSKFYKALDTKLSFATPNETIFRLLGNYKFNFKKKNCLDIGIGNGDNLLEFKRRKGNIFGIDIRKNIINNFCKKYKLQKNNFFICDLNYNFPKISQKMNLVNMKDTLYYIDLDKQFSLFKNIYNQLEKEGLFIFQYIQQDLILKKKKFFQYDLIKNYSKLTSYHIKKNPIQFLTNNNIMQLIKSTKFKILRSIFDINTHALREQIVTINRYFILKK